MLVGLLARWGGLSHLAIEHFDEGVYASNLLFDESEGAQYPGRHLYAPPLFPWMVEWATVFLGQGPGGNFAVSILAGTALVAAVGWVTHRWFGSFAGGMAASLMAASDPFVLFSGTCLTDVPLCLWWVLALGVLHQAVFLESRSWAAVAGALVALAWWTKYNGWLPLAIGLSAIVAWAIAVRPGRAALKGALATWGVAAMTAVVLWSPIWWGLQDRGGYSAVAANHARYFHGPAGWPAAFARQLGNLQAIDSLVGAWVAWTVLGVTAVFLAISAMGLVLIRRDARLAAAGRSFLDPPPNAAPRRPGRVRAVEMVVVVAVLAVLLGAINFWGAGAAILIVAGVAVVGMIPDLLSREGDRRAGLASWFAVAWFVGMLVMTPMYRAYPRLTLPLLAGAFVCLGAVDATSVRRGLQRWLGETGAVSGRGRKIEWLLAGVVSLGGLLLMSFGPSVRPPITNPPDRTGLEKVSLEINEAARRIASDESRGRSDAAVVYVYAEPAILYHLRVTGGVVAGPISSLRFAEPGQERHPVPTFLVVGPHARRTPEFVEQWEKLSPRFDWVATWDWQPSLAVLLDHEDPRTVREATTPLVQPIELFRLK